MQATLLSIFFFITCGFAQKRSLPNSADNNLVADVKKLPSAVENPDPNPEDDGISTNVEDLRRELIAERAKNRDLNQTIADILERMEEMEKNIMSNQEKITAVQDDVVTVAEDVERNSANINSLGARGSWCAARSKDSWSTDYSTITYDVLTYSDSNMNITGTPLDIDTGNNSHKCYYLSGY